MSKCAYYPNAGCSFEQPAFLFENYFAFLVTSLWTNKITSRNANSEAPALCTMPNAAMP